MHGKKDELREMIRRQLGRRRPPDTSALYGRAVRIDPDVRQLDLRQFNATHVLPVRKELSRDQGPEAGADERVRALVKRRLVEDPTRSTETLYEECVEVAPSLRGLDLRQFHARYALPLKRRLPGGESAPEGDEPGLSPGSDRMIRERIRAVFFEFAVALEGAPNRAETVRLLAGLDDYVDRVMVTRWG